MQLKDLLSKYWHNKVNVSPKDYKVIRVIIVINLDIF